VLLSIARQRGRAVAAGVRLLPMPKDA